MLLKDLFDFLPKPLRPASCGQKEGMYPFFTSSNNVDKFLNFYDYDGEFLIIGDGGKGNCKYYNGKFSASDHNHILKPLKETNCKLIRYFLMKEDYKILNEGFKGVGIKNVSKTYIKNINFKKNKNLSDEKMVNLLSRIEKTINLKEKQIIEYENLIKSRFIKQEIKIWSLGH